MQKKISASLLAFLLFILCVVNISAQDVHNVPVGAQGELAVIGNNVELNANVELSQNISLPSAYSSKAEGYTTAVRQQNANTCWAFGTTAAMETLLNKDGKNVSHLSPQHMNIWGTKEINGNGWNRQNIWTASGYSYIPIGYLTSWSGTFYESQFPETTDFPSGITYKNNFELFNSMGTPEYGVTEIKYIDETTPIDTIKSYIYNYGAVVGNFSADTNMYINRTFDSFYCGDSTLSASELVGHTIAVVGWDDNYSKNKFSTSYSGDTPENDGAWLIKNSWGSYVNRAGGYFWISYEDAWLFNSIFGPSFVITEYMETDETHILYQNEIYGATFMFQYLTTIGSNRIPAAKPITYVNVFDFAEDDRLLDTVVFESVSLDADYKVFYIPVENGKPTADRTRWTQLSEGVVDVPGYFSIDCNDFVMPRGTGAIGVEIDNTRTYNENKDKPGYKYIRNSIGVCEYLTSGSTSLFNYQGEYGLSFTIHDQGQGDVVTDIMDEYKTHLKDTKGGTFAIKAITQKLEQEPPTTPPTDTTEPTVFTTTEPPETTTTPPSSEVASTTAEPTESTTVVPSTTFEVDDPVVYMLGDTDLDMNVNIKDCTLIQKIVAKLAESEEKNTLSGDVNGDEKLTIDDASLIQKYVANIPTEYEIGKTIMFFP